MKYYPNAEPYRLFKCVFVTNGHLRNVGKLRYDVIWRTDTLLLYVESICNGKQIKQRYSNVWVRHGRASEPVTSLPLEWRGIILEQIGYTWMYTKYSQVMACNTRIGTPKTTFRSRYSVSMMMIYYHRMIHTPFARATSDEKR
jgi:hypothetical protein